MFPCAFNIGMFGKHKPTARDYVQNGLISMWDGIENAGWGVHDPNATVWKDLIGVNDFDLSACQYEINKNSITVTGGEAVAQYLDKGRAETAEAVVSLQYTPTVYQPVEFLSWPENNTNGYQRNFGLSQEMRPPSLSTGSSGVAKTTFDFRPVANVPFSISAYYIKNQSNANSCFVDSERKNAGVDYHYAPLQIDALKIWNRNGTTNPTVFNFRFYNRELTPAEIAANYAVDKARFGLT